MSYTYTYIDPEGKYLMVESTILKQKHVEIYYCKVLLHDIIILKRLGGIHKLQDTIENNNIIYDDNNKYSPETIMSMDTDHVADQKKKMYIVLTEYPGVSIKMNFIPTKDFSWMKNEEMDELKKHSRVKLATAFNPFGVPKLKTSYCAQLESENASLKKEMSEFKNKFDTLSSLDYINFCHNDVLVEDKKRLQDKITELQILNNYLQSSEMQMKRKKCDEYLDCAYKKTKP
jgi:hypothetical protein